MNDQNNECNSGWTLSKVIFYQMTTLLMSGNLCSLVWYLNKINHSERVTETYQEVTLPQNVCLDSLADA